MTGLSLLRTSTSKVSSVTTLVAPTAITSLSLRCLIPATQVSSVFLAGQPALRVQRRRAARPRRGDRLPVGAVHDVAAGEDAFDPGPCRRLIDQQLAVSVGGKLAREPVRPPVVADA